MGLLNDTLVAVGDTEEEVLCSLIARMNPDKAELLTLYYGADSRKEAAEELARSIRDKHPHLEVEIIEGGQPYYPYLLTLE